MTSESSRNTGHSAAPGAERARQSSTHTHRVLPEKCIIGGSYCVEKLLGRGGMGEVYLAYHMKLDIYRAIKILLPGIVEKNPHFAKRFMQEAKLAIRLQHPNIINVVDAEYDKNLKVYYIVMEYVDGGNVRSLIRRKGLLSDTEVLKIVRKVGEALAAGEEKQIVHRDIKPDNIMITANGEVKLADLGIAKDSAAPSETLHSEALIGTPAYVSPEQAENAQNVDSRADIYSLGVAMYEMLTGEKPYQGKRTVEILQQIFTAPVPEVRLKNRNVNRKLSDLVYRMMAKSKKERPRNWQVFCAEVEELIESEYPVLSESAAPVFHTGRSKFVKAARYVGFALAGFALCFMLFGGRTLREYFRGAEGRAVLVLTGEPYRSLCKKFRLQPSFSFLLLSDAEKMAWIKSKIPPPKTPVRSVSYGSCEFVISIAPEVKEYLKMKNHQLSVSDRKHFSDRKIPLSGGTIGKLTPGTYTFAMNVPECRAIPELAVEVKKDAVSIVNVAVVPMKATLKIKCNAERFKVWWNNLLQDTAEVNVDSLRSGEVAVQAPGYKLFTETVKLQPGEKRVMEISLEKELPPDSENMRLANGAFAERKYSAALKYYRIEAEKGHPLAMYRLGMIYEQGLIYEQALGMLGASYKEAFRYYRMAAHKELPDAIFKTGEFYEHGKGGVRKSDEEALKWYRLGAKKKHPLCMVKVALFYEDGRGGVKKDVDAALRLFLKNAARGDAVSRFHAGRIYERKLMLETTQSKRDEYKKSAKHFYEAAARQGHEEARARVRGL